MAQLPGRGRAEGIMRRGPRRRPRTPGGQVCRAVHGIDSAWPDGRSVLGIFKRGPQVTGRTVGVMGDHLTGEEIAAVMSGALGEKVLYEPVIWAEYASFGFPGAQELANQFQWFSEGTDMFAKEFSIEQTGQSIPPCLTSQAGSTPIGTSFPLTDRRTRRGARLQPAGRPASSALQRVRAGPGSARGSHRVSGPVPGVFRRVWVTARGLQRGRPREHPAAGRGPRRGCPRQTVKSTVSGTPPVP